MTKQEFYNLFGEKLQLKDKLNEETRLDTMSEWDSWAKLEILTLIDEIIKVNLTGEDLMEVQTLKDLTDKIGSQHFE